MQLIRDVSQALFSAPYRLEILLVVMEIAEEPFTSGQVHAALLERLGDEAEDVPDQSTTNRTLKNLREAALVERAGKAGKYRRVDSRFWELLSEYNNELEKRFAPKALGAVADPA